MHNEVESENIINEEGSSLPVIEEAPELLDEDSPATAEIVEEKDKVFLIDGKGFYLRFWYLHVISLATLFFMMRYTFFDFSDHVIGQHPSYFWVLATVVPLCTHMVLFSKFFVSLAERMQVNSILMNFIKEDELPKTKHAKWIDLVDVLEKTGEFNMRNDSNSGFVTFVLTPPSKKRVLRVAHS